MSEPTRVLLIGATGIVGTDLLDLLAATSGMSVIATSRKPPVTESRANVKWQAVDLTGPFDLKEAIAASDWIILNAASKVSGATFAELEELNQINVHSVSRIIHSLSAAGNKRLLYVSSLSVLQRPLCEPIRETDPCAPITAYSLSKYWGEILANKLHGTQGCRSSIIRISSPVPRRLELMDTTVLKRWLSIAMAGGTIEIHGKGERTQDFISTEDIAQGCLSIIMGDRAGLYHLASGQPVSMRQLAQIILEELPEARITEYPDKPGNDHERWHLDISKATRDLNFKPLHDLRSSIRRLLQ